MYQKLKIISRSSRLAKIQAHLVGEELKKVYEDLTLEYFTTDSKADLDQSINLASSGQVGLFTKDITQKIIDADFDIAVHSWKDIPVQPSSQTIVAGTLPRGDMRDVVIFKRNILKQKKGNIEILTSSPRRKFNLTKVLPDLIPASFEKITFKDIRGNIETRLKKFNQGSSQGIILAKVAIDRLTNFGSQDVQKMIKGIIHTNKWVILPLSVFPTAPGQGAIAIEIKKDREELFRFLNRINSYQDYNSVIKEKKIMSEYGGGCHQKIGVSVWEKSDQTILSLTGETENGDQLKEFSLLNNNDLREKKIEESNNLYPIDKKADRFFNRVLIDNSKKIEKIKKSFIYLSRKNVLDNCGQISNSNFIWTSGLSSWKSAVKKGYWVSGTSDSFGEDDLLLLDNFLPSEIVFFKLSHSGASSDKYLLVPTYELKPRTSKIECVDLSKKTHFFWMSPTQFDQALKECPNIIKKQHSCGLGKTYKYLKNVLPNEKNIRPFLSFSDWIRFNSKEIK